MTRFDASAASIFTTNSSTLAFIFLHEKDFSMKQTTTHMKVSFDAADQLMHISLEYLFPLFYIRSRMFNFLFEKNTFSNDFSQPFIASLVG